MAKITEITQGERVAQGALILSELNDLKRTIGSCSKELGWEQAEVEAVVEGRAEDDTVTRFIDDFTGFYPVRRTSLTLPRTDCTNGVRKLDLEASVASARVFERPTADGGKSPYYEYRDTAMSVLSDYRPEWIEQLRVVDDNDPNNPDVIYNNGHFMHQVTFFVGPVNFYYEVDGVRYCEEMTTGGSNYITPFCPHSFTSRDASEQAYIVAVTFGNNAKRALGELVTLGEARSERYLVDRSSKTAATQDLVDYHLGNARLTRELLDQRLTAAGATARVGDRKASYSQEQIAEIAAALNIRPADLMVVDAPSAERVIVKKTDPAEAYAYPSPSNSAYRIWPLATTRQLPGVTFHRISVNSADSDFRPDFTAGTHTYLFNYSETDCHVVWEYGGEVFRDTLRKGDSLYIQPQTPHSFHIAESDSGAVAELVCVGVPSAIDQEVQLELSNMGDFSRVIQESKCWF